MAAGKILTGFSLPYVAKYVNNGGYVSYTGGRRLARGVDVSVEPEVGDDNRFYADNVTAESEPGVFTGGTVTLTVDGLLQESERFLFGLPEPESINVGEREVKITKYGDAMNIPYVGVGYVARYMEDGLTTYVPTVLTKVRFVTPGEEAATQEDSIEWQTQELEGTLHRDDTPGRDWRFKGEPQASEAAAEAVIRHILGIGNLISIAITTPPTTTEYVAEQPFDPAGMVITATYSTGRRQTVTTYSYSPAGALAPEDTEITVTYTEAGVTRTAAQPITVT